MGLGTSEKTLGFRHSKDSLGLGAPGFKESRVGHSRDERGVDRARRRVEFKV